MTKRFKLYESLRRSNDVSGPKTPRPFGLGRKWPACFVIAPQRLVQLESLRRSASHSGHFRPNADPIGSFRGSDARVTQTPLQSEERWPPGYTVRNIRRAGASVMR
jgi:hypothetical protein